jgi:hypothetical protein
MAQAVITTARAGDFSLNPLQHLQDGLPLPQQIPDIAIPILRRRLEAEGGEFAAQRFVPAPAVRPVDNAATNGGRFRGGDGGAAVVAELPVAAFAGAGTQVGKGLIGIGLAGKCRIDHEEEAVVLVTVIDGLAAEEVKGLSGLGTVRLSQLPFPL